MIKVQETLTHSLDIPSFVAQLRQRTGLNFKVGDIVKITPPTADTSKLKAGAETQATDEDETPEVVKTVSNAIREALGAQQVEIRRLFGTVTRHNEALADRPWIIASFDGDGDIHCATICEHGELITRVFQPEDLSRWPDEG